MASLDSLQALASLAWKAYELYQKLKAVTAKAHAFGNKLLRVNQLLTAAAECGFEDVPVFVTMRASVRETLDASKELAERITAKRGFIANIKLYFGAASVESQLDALARQLTDDIIMLIAAQSVCLGVLMRQPESTRKMASYQRYLAAADDIRRPMTSDAREMARRDVAMDSDPAPAAGAFAAGAAAAWPPAPTPTGPTGGAGTWPVAASRRIRRSELAVVRELATSDESVVYEAVYRGVRDAYVAVKMPLMDTGRLSDTRLDDYEREAHILTTLPPDSNIVTTYGMLADDDETSGRPLIGLVMEEVAGDVESLVVSTRARVHVSTVEALLMLFQAAAGLEHLHRNGIYHGDVRAASIMLDVCGTAKMGNLMQAKVAPPTSGMAALRMSIAAHSALEDPSLAWRAPERVPDSHSMAIKPRSAATDAYSFGMTMWEVLARATPYADLVRTYGPARTLDRVLREGLRPQLDALPADTPRAVTKLITDCWATDPARRPAMHDVVVALSSALFGLGVADCSTPMVHVATLLVAAGRAADLDALGLTYEEAPAPVPAPAPVAVPAPAPWGSAAFVVPAPAPPAAGFGGAPARPPAVAGPFDPAGPVGAGRSGFGGGMAAVDIFTPGFISYATTPAPVWPATAPPAPVPAPIPAPPPLRASPAPPVGHGHLAPSADVTDSLRSVSRAAGAASLTGSMGLQLAVQVRGKVVPPSWYRPAGPFILLETPPPAPSTAAAAVAFDAPSLVTALTGLMAVSPSAITPASLIHAWGFILVMLPTSVDPARLATMVSEQLAPDDCREYSKMEVHLVYVGQATSVASQVTLVWQVRPKAGATSDPDWTLRQHANLLHEIGDDLFDDRKALRDSQTVFVPHATLVPLPAGFDIARARDAVQEDLAYGPGGALYARVRECITPPRPTATRLAGAAAAAGLPPAAAAAAGFGARIPPPAAGGAGAGAGGGAIAAFALAAAPGGGARPTAPPADAAAAAAAVVAAATAAAAAASITPPVAILRPRPVAGGGVHRVHVGTAVISVPLPEEPLGDAAHGWSVFLRDVPFLHEAHPKFRSTLNSLVVANSPPGTVLSAKIAVFPEFSSAQVVFNTAAAASSFYQRFEALEIFPDICAANGSPLRCAVSLSPTVEMLLVGDDAPLTELPAAVVTGWGNRGGTIDIPAVPMPYNALCVVLPDAAYAREAVSKAGKLIIEGNNYEVIPRSKPLLLDNVAPTATVESIRVSIEMALVEYTERAAKRYGLVFRPVAGASPVVAVRWFPAELSAAVFLRDPMSAAAAADLAGIPLLDAPVSARGAGGDGGGGGGARALVRMGTTGGVTLRMRIVPALRFGVQLGPFNVHLTAAEVLAQVRAALGGESEVPEVALTQPDGDRRFAVAWLASNTRQKALLGAGSVTVGGAAKSVGAVHQSLLFYNSDWYHAMDATYPDCSYAEMDKDETLYMRRWSPIRWLDALRSATSELRGEAKTSAVSRLRQVAFYSTYALVMRLSSYTDVDGNLVAYHRNVSPGIIVPRPVPVLRAKLSEGLERRVPIPMLVEVVDEDALSAAARLTGAGSRTLVVIATNAEHPMGNYKRGDGSMEASIAYRTDAWFGLDREFSDAAPAYPLADNGVAIRNVTVFRGSEESGYDFLPAPFSVDVFGITSVPRASAGPRLQAAEVVRIARKIETAITHAINAGYDTVVLPAYGCGVMGYPADHVAIIYRETLRKYNGLLRRAVFAITRRPLSAVAATGSTDPHSVFTSHFGSMTVSGFMRMGAFEESVPVEACRYGALCGDTSAAHRGHYAHPPQCPMIQSTGSCLITEETHKQLFQHPAVRR